MNPPRHPTPFPPLCASAWGDDRFGLWFEITVPGAGAGDAIEVTQRLRWIEPGAFWMGSPEGEPERFEDEGPRHRVTLSEGFWLADTACTQALWLAVMGKIPSHFKDETIADLERPVEQVSWHEAQGFLAKLQALLPGVQAVLPTEAQWEYACRAGTDKPFSFGKNITPEQVNYYGYFPYNGGAKGEDREQTVPVKSLPANAWGLHEMHGNVWEWCADGQRLFTADDVVDPVGQLGPGAGNEPNSQPQDKTNAEREEECGLRGGSWGSDAGLSRSAYRFALLPGYAGSDFGFRIALRSTGPGPGRDGPRQRAGNET